MNQKPIKLRLKNLITCARGAAGVKLFQHVYVQNEAGHERDVMNAGELSCAYVISGILTLHGLIDRPHATVATTLEKMQQHGWQKVASGQAGDVVYWPEHNGHEHIGIVLGPDECVSNSDKLRAPAVHGFTLSSGVQPTAFYRHPELSANQ